MKLLDLKSPDPRVLAIDCSTKSLAFAMFDGTKLESYGEVTFPGKSTFERLGVGQEIMRQLQDKFNPDKIVFEGAVYVQNKKTVILLAMALGAFVSPIVGDAQVVEVAPISWQNAIGNKPLTKEEKAVIKENNPDQSETWLKEAGRQERKRRTMDFINKTYGIMIESDNISDAIGLGHAVARGLI